MPGLTEEASGRRKKRLNVWNSDDDNDDNDDNAASNVPTPNSAAGSTSSNKRARLSREATSTSTPSSADAGVENSFVEGDLYDDEDGDASGAAQDVTPGATPDGEEMVDEEHDIHRPGSIVRVKLVNFVTYTAAEFRPGPRLNMVIGPNGTGKSTLVCAICLGLGWGPTHLGRTTVLGEFVKHGCREGSIEIELARDPKRMENNPVIRRIIKKEDNKSVFTVNEQPATQKKVLEFAQSFSIQVDNLCQFLPQDRVAEFAGLTPVQLLHSTQRAAAPPEMLEWHDKLKELRDKQKRIRSHKRVNKEELTTSEDRQNQQRVDVERMRTRAIVAKRLKLLEKFRPVPKYDEAVKKVRELEAVRAAAEEEFRSLKARVAPTLRAVNDKEKYANAVEAEVKTAKAKLQQAEADANTRKNDIVGYEDRKKEAEIELNQEKDNSKRRKEEQMRVTQAIARIERQIRDEAVEFDAASYNDKIREKQRTLQEMNRTWEDRKMEMARWSNESRGKDEQIASAERELQRLDSEAGKQELKLQQVSKDAAQAWNWIQQNKDQFEREVFGPVMVVCSVKDPKFIDSIESLFQRNDFTAFTVQSTRDFQTLQAQLASTMGLHNFSIKTCSKPLDEVCRHPVSRQDLQTRGFDGWAIDFISGPEPVLAMLCQENRIDSTAIRLRDVANEDYERLASDPRFSNFVAGKNSYRITRRREYGDSATSTRVNPLKPAQIWNNQPVDLSAKRELQEKIEQWTVEREEGLAKANQIRTEGVVMKERYILLGEENKNLLREKSTKQTAFTLYNSLPTKLEKEKEKLVRVQQAGEEIRTRSKHIGEKFEKIALHKAQACMSYVTAVDTLRKCYEAYIQAEIKHIEAVSDFETLKLENTEIKNQLTSKQQESERALKEMKEASHVAKQLRKHVEALKQAADELEAQGESFEGEILVEVSAKSSDQLEADIDSAKAELEIAQGGNMNIIAEYEKREEKIRKLKQDIAEADHLLGELQHGITDIRGRWEPKLDALVQNISDAFSYNFAQIGCAGQVSVYKADDSESGDDADSNFDQWSIEIQVKFREHEALSILDQHRQSGGERAVSTIFYLMALQSLSASPFRVVDEINQGMDPRNERMVHERMVDIACDKGGSQYFLITPKLLTGLKYKPGMKVHCIVSGAFMPEEGGVVDFKSCVERMRAARSGANGNGRMASSGVAIRSSIERGLSVGVGA